MGEKEVVFIYKHVDSDRFLDSILLFLPKSVSDDDKITLCSQLVGISQFCEDFADSPCQDIEMDDGSLFAFLTVNSFTMVNALRGEVLSSADSSAKQVLSNMYSMFALYFNSFDYLLKTDCHDDMGALRAELHRIFSAYLDIAYRRGDRISRSFNSLPAITQRNCSKVVFEKIVELYGNIRCDILGSMMTYTYRILISKFRTSLSYSLLINKNHLKIPCSRVIPDYELPSSIQLFVVWLNEEDEFTHTKARHSNNQDSQNVDSGLVMSITNETANTSIQDNDESRMGRRKQFLLFTVSCSNMKYYAILNKGFEKNETQIMDLWKVLMKYLSEIDILLKNDTILNIPMAKNNDNYLVFNELTNELSGHMLISSGENDKEMFFKSIDMHDKLKKLVNNSELEIRNENYTINGQKKNEEVLFEFKKH